jgi:small subunit ribosomal protein S8
MPYLTDPIGDLLTRLRNAQAARRQTCTAPWSRIKQELMELLKKEGFIESVEVTGDAPKQEITITFVPGRAALTLKRVSKPGRRLYTQKKNLKPVLQGFGIAVLSTSLGLLTDREAKIRNVGGEYLCTVS